MSHKHTHMWSKSCFISRGYLWRQNEFIPWKMWDLCLVCLGDLKLRNVLCLTQPFPGNGGKDTESHLAGHWCSPQLLPFPHCLHLDPLGSELSVVETPSPPYIWHKSMHRDAVVRQTTFCTITMFRIKGQMDHSKLMWDLWTQSLSGYSSNSCMCRFVYVFYSAFLYYEMTPPIFPCSMCYTDVWQTDDRSATTKQALHISERRKTLHYQTAHS